MSNWVLSSIGPTDMVTSTHPEEANSSPAHKPMLALLPRRHPEVPVRHEPVEPHDDIRRRELQPARGAPQVLRHVLGVRARYVSPRVPSRDHRFVVHRRRRRHIPQNTRHETRIGGEVNRVGARLAESRSVVNVVGRRPRRSVASYTGSWRRSARSVAVLAARTPRLWMVVFFVRSLHQPRSLHA